MPDATAGAPGTVRVGVATGIPEPWGSALDQARADAGDPLAEFIPAHVTLLGPTDVPSSSLDAIEEHLADVAPRFGPFPVRLRGTGTFRPITEVVFVAVAAGISEFERLASAVRAGPLERELHFPYHPHVTVAHDIATEALDKVFDDLADFSAQFEVDQFTLYVHGADGRWRPRRAYPLGTSAA